MVGLDTPWKEQAHALMTKAWKLFDEGDLEGAEEICRRALVTDPESAEAVLLLGQIRLEHGDPRGAMQRFEQAIEIDPDWAEPYLFAAETALFDLDDPHSAVQFATEVVERTDDQTEFVDALLLKSEALLVIGSKDAIREAREDLRHVPPILNDAALCVRAGRVYLDLEEYDPSERYFRQAIACEPGNADAWHGLGCCLEAKEDHHGMVEAWLKTRELDLKAPNPPWSLSDKEFEDVAAASMDALHPEIRRLIGNVPVLVRDYPDEDIIRQGFDPRILGFFMGIPYAEKGTLSGTPPHLDCILLFKRNIERAALNKEEAIEEISITLLHETGHFFALSDEQLEAMGLG